MLRSRTSLPLKNYTTHEKYYPLHSHLVVFDNGKLSLENHIYKEGDFADVAAVYIDGKLTFTPSEGPDHTHEIFEGGTITNIVNGHFHYIPLIGEFFTVFCGGLISISEIDKFVKNETKTMLAQVDFKESGGN